MKLGRFRRRFKRTCLIWILIVAFLYIIPSNIKFTSLQYLLGDDWARCEISPWLLDHNSLPYLQLDFQAEKCNRGNPPLVKRSGSFLYRARVPNFDSKDVRCWYTPAIPTHPGEEKWFRYGTSFELGSRKEIANEFVLVNCTYKDVTVFEDYFAFYPKKRWHAKPKSRNAFDVLLVGIKGVSRLNLYRTMPRTVAYLKDKLRAIEFVKYNRVANDTFGNLAPLLTGFDIREFHRNCNNGTCPLILYSYMNAGYMTAFAEDCPTHGLLRHDYELKTRLAHYYWSPCGMALDVLAGNLKKGNCSVCLRDKMSYQILLDYARNFALAMRQSISSHFGVFWSSSLTSADNPTDGLYLVSLADKGYEAFFRQLYEDGLLENTVIIFFSESGYASSHLSDTGLHASEAKLPFLFIVFPEKFEARYPELVSNAKRNREHLVTTFDVHRTLLDLINLRGKILPQPYRRRSHSLLGKFPSARKCSWAGIDSKQCSCGDSFKNLLMELL